MCEQRFRLACALSVQKGTKAHFLQHILLFSSPVASETGKPTGTDCSVHQFGCFKEGQQALDDDLWKGRPALACNEDIIVCLRGIPAGKA
jgi:hypothetical protein